MNILKMTDEELEQAIRGYERKRSTFLVGVDWKHIAQFIRDCVRDSSLKELDFADVGNFFMSEFGCDNDEANERAEKFIKIFGSPAQEKLEEENRRLREACEYVYKLVCDHTQWEDAKEILKQALASQPKDEK